MIVSPLSFRSVPHLAGEAGNEPNAARDLLLLPEGRQPGQPAGENGGRDPILPAQVLPEEQAAWPEAWPGRSATHSCRLTPCLTMTNPEASEISTTNWLPVVPVAAAGLLLCHELPLQTDADSRASGRLVSLSQSYQHTLASLIREV